MVANITFNPLLTSNAPGTFNIESTGYIQGTALDNPAARFYHSGGYLASTETLPMWGGVGITELIPGVAGQPNPSLGGAIGRATVIGSAGTAGSLTGFSVFDQNASAINSPQSPVPLVGSYGQVNFYRLGSNARIAVAIDPTLVSLDGSIITSEVSWDFVNQMIVPYYAANAGVGISSMSWANTAGGTVSVATAAAHGLAVGDQFVVTGAVPTAYNGTWTVASSGSTTTLTFLLPAAATPGAVTTLGSIPGGGGLLPARILDVKIGNCMTVNFSATTGYATWNYNGNAAIILI
jgi:hypothetical protein